jgi:pimeloyl-ACP methyl ester carboxylesterase
MSWLERIGNRRFVKRVLIGAVAAFLLVVVVGNVYRVYGRYMLDREFPAPGRMVDIGTHSMHMHCAGEGLPMVLLEAGGAGFSTGWAEGGVFDAIQSITRVCAYDRSGLGWSESGPAEVTPANQLEDLEKLLEASGESGPYIFVGTSYGAGLAWLYAQRHIDDAAGVITLDGVLNDRSGRSDEYMQDFSVSPLLQVALRTVKALGLQPLVIRAIAAPAVDESQISEWALPAFRRGHFLSEGVLDQWFMDVETSIKTYKEIGSLGDVPLIVITHTQVGEMLQFMWRDRADEMEVLWQDAQADMATLSSNAQLLEAESGHRVTLEDPDIVLDAIREQVENYRDRARRE